MKHCIALITLLFAGTVAAQGPALTVREAVTIATGSDPWLEGSELRQRALRDEAAAAASLPDPKLNLMAGNFPVDSFDIRQEPMTQVGIGISQMFPRGESRELGRQQKEQLSAREPLLRADRRAQVAATVTDLWLRTYLAQQSIALIEDNRALFSYLVDAARSSYASSLGGARQQDVVRAQVELTRLEDRLSALRQDQSEAQQRLAEWISGDALRPVAGDLPAPALPLAPGDIAAAQRDRQRAWEILVAHPALRALEQRIEATTTGVDLAKQQYSPGWGISAQYGYRADDLAGRERADLFSVGVTVDLPLFTAERQDRQVSAAAARSEALKTERALLARRLVARLQSELSKLTHLSERNRRYRDELLPQMAQQAEAALNAYNNDDGDFAEAVRARIDELDARLTALALAVEEQQALAQLNYLLAGYRSAPTPAQPGDAS